MYSWLNITNKEHTIQITQESGLCTGGNSLETLLVCLHHYSAVLKSISCEMSYQILFSYVGQ